MENKSKAEENSGQNRTRSQMWGKGDGGSPLEMHAKHPGLLPQSPPPGSGRNTTPGGPTITSPMRESNRFFGHSDILALYPRKEKDWHKLMANSVIKQTGTNQATVF